MIFVSKSWDSSKHRKSTEKRLANQSVFCKPNKNSQIIAGGVNGSPGRGRL